jgi:hypothetical protein
MNLAYKHLDAKLRFGELTIGQWIGVILGLGTGVVWGLYLSPLGELLTIVTSIYIAALPVGAAVSANYTEFDPWLVLRSALAWRRREGRFIPGPGESAHGYVVYDDTSAGGREETLNLLPELDLASLWESP